MKTKIVEITPEVAFRRWEHCQRFFIGTRHKKTFMAMQREPLNAIETDDAPFASYAASAARSLGVCQSKVRYFEKRHIRPVGERVMDAISLHGGYIAGKLFRIPV